MGSKRWAGLAAIAVAAVSAGGCAVYSTPTGEVITPAPVVVSPPVVVAPFYWGYSHYHYPAPYYYGYPRYPAPRYYGRPYYRY